MKKSVLTYFSLAILLNLGICSQAKSQNVNIPDENFKNALLAIRNLDTNGDGEIQVKEAVAYSGTISLYGLGINDLTGIEAFTSLTWLDCTNNNLRNLDVSSNTSLTTLSCDKNHLTSIDVSNNLELTYLDCSNNEFTYLDISKNLVLTAFTCYNNQLVNLNIKNGKNSKLKSFSATSNPQLCTQVDDPAFMYLYWKSAIDSSSTYSATCTAVGINETMKTGNFSILPNPFSEQVTIELENYQNATIEISDIEGRVLQNVLLQAQRTSILTSNLISGIYFIKLKTARGMLTKKLVKF